MGFKIHQERSGRERTVFYKQNQALFADLNLGGETNYKIFQFDFHDQKAMLHGLHSRTLLLSCTELVSSHDSINTHDFFHNTLQAIQ